MHDSRTWRQRTGAKTLSHPPTLLFYRDSQMPIDAKAITSFSGVELVEVSSLESGKYTSKYHSFSSWTHVKVCKIRFDSDR